MDIDAVYDERFEGGDEEDLKIKDDLLKLDNTLLNIWIRCYYQKFWVQGYKSLSKQWQKEILDDFKEYNKYFNWNGNKCYIKDDITLNNKECIILESIIENYDGLRDFSTFRLLDDCTDEENTQIYIDSLRKTGNFPN